MTDANRQPSNEAGDEATPVFTHVPIAHLVAWFNQKNAELTREISVLDRLKASAAAGEVDSEAVGQDFEAAHFKILGGLAVLRSFADFLQSYQHLEDIREPEA